MKGSIDLMQGQLNPATNIYDLPIIRASMNPLTSGPALLLVPAITGALITQSGAGVLGAGVGAVGTFLLAFAGTSL